MKDAGSKLSRCRLITRKTTDCKATVSIIHVAFAGDVMYQALI